MILKVSFTLAEYVYFVGLYYDSSEKKKKKKKKKLESKR